MKLKILFAAIVGIEVMSFSACGLWSKDMAELDATDEEIVNDIENQAVDIIENNDIVLTENKVEVKPFCSYSIENLDGKYLACENGQLTMHDNEYSWIFDPIVYHTYAGSYMVTAFEEDDSKGNIFDINNATYFDNNTVSVYQNTGYFAQYFDMVEASIDGENGFLFASAEYPEYILHNGENGFVIVKSDKATRDDLYKLNYIGDHEYNIMESQKGVMIFQYEDRVLDVISAERLQQWLDDYEQAYFAYSEIEGGAPFDKVYVFDTENTDDYWAAYWGNGVIRMNSDCAYEEFEKIAKRDVEDISFGMLHELGHLFDDNKPWVFEAEGMTDIKLPYVLKKTGFYSAPAEYDASMAFNYENIDECYKMNGTCLEDQYGAFEISAKMYDIYEEVGFEVLEKVLQNFPDTEGKTKYEIFEIWLEEHSKYSGRDIKEMFNDKEIANVKKALSE